MIRARIRRRGLLLASLMVALAGCRGHGGSRRQIPSGMSIELPAGAAVPVGLSPRLAAIGARAFFVPAVAGRAQGDRVTFERLPPSRLPPGAPVYLEVTGRGDFTAALDRDSDRVAAALWEALAPAAVPGAGRVAGVHLAWGFRATSKGPAALMRALRLRLPPAFTLSASIDSRLSDAERKSWRGVARVADFVVVQTLGRGESADLAGTRYEGRLADARELGIPIIAGYAPQGWGVRRASDGSLQGVVPDSAVNELSEDRRFDFSFGDLLKQTDEDVYIFSARAEARSRRWEGPAFPGSTIAFRQRRVADLTQSMAEARSAAGKLVRLASLEDDGRLIGFGVLEDIVLGRRLEPRLTFSRSGPGSGIVFVAVNTSPESSALSRWNNWVDLRIAGARIGEVRPGDFDRYLFLDERARPVAAFRARTVRLFENFVAPEESMSTGIVRLSGPAEIFASAHLTLADGTVVKVPESRVEAAGSAEQSASGIERGSGGKRQPVEGKPHR